MATFGIIAEGITDQIVIENILRGCFEDEDEEPIVNYAQPLLDQTGRSAAPAAGGWTLVLDYLARGEHLKALQWNDYLVIQIDTDVSEQKGYDVPWREGGKELTPRELTGKVIERLKGLIGEDVCARHGHQLLFAVAVHGIECWLMPLFFSNKKAAKIAGCLQTVNNERRKKNQAPLSKADGEDKSPRAYGDASRPYAKRKLLLEHHDKNPSLCAFVEQVEALRTG
jgi:hypothetical protein